MTLRKAREIQAIVQVIVDYFSTISNERASIGVPYVSTGSEDQMDYTSAIGISGSMSGALFFSASSALVTALVEQILGAVEGADPWDMVGEVGNTIAGNLRERFGSEFIISVPISIKSEVDVSALGMGEPIFAIPIRWSHQKAVVAVGLA